MSTRWKTALAGGRRGGGGGRRRDRPVRPGERRRRGDRATGHDHRARCPATATRGERTITVNGHGTVSVVPDTADLMAGVQAQDETATAALDDGVGELAGADRPRSRVPAWPTDDIQTSGLSLWPTYGSDGQRITGYQASTNVTATIRDVAAVGGVVDALKGFVGDELTLSGISFSYDDPEAVLAEARAGAIANATVRAEQYAEAAGVEVGAIVTDHRGQRLGPDRVPRDGRRAAGRRRVARRGPRVAGARRRRDGHVRDGDVARRSVDRSRRAGYGPSMADQPSWRQGFDALEKQLSPRLEALVQSEQFAVAVGLAARVQRAVEGEMSRVDAARPAPPEPARRHGRQPHPQRDRPAARAGARAVGRARRGPRRAGLTAAGAGRRRSASGHRPRSGRPSGRARPDGHRPHTGRGRRARAARRRAQRAARAQRAQAPRRRRATAAHADAEGDDLVGREGRAVALPERPRALPDAAAVRAQPRVAQLRVRPRARQQLHRDDARPRLRHLPRRLGRARRAGERQHAGDVQRRLHPAGRRRGPAPLRRRRTSTCSATASAGCCRCCRWPATRTCRSAAWP